MHEFGGVLMSLLNFKEDAERIMSHIQKKMPRWEGDIIDLSDADKDAFCYHFLQHMESWWDDVLPTGSMSQEPIIHAIYAQREKDSRLANLIKGDIYLVLESTLRDLIQELYDDINYVDLLSSAEYFAGYERGQ